MSTITVSQSHAVAPAEARTRLASFEQTLGKYGVSLRWSGLKATIKGLSVSGKLEVRQRSVDVTVSLGLLARAAGVDPIRLEATIQRRLESAFASLD